MGGRRALRSDATAAYQLPWLGISQLELGNVDQVLATLERARMLVFERCDGVEEMLPLVELAITRTSWDRGGDRDRARRFAEHSLAGARRLRNAERIAAAQQWLDEHRG